MTRSEWAQTLHAEFRTLDIRQVAHVPDAGHAELIRLCEADPQVACVSLTTEEEGVALLAGAWLGGQRGALLLQSSGVGNCINMLTLPRETRMPLLMLVTMRGEWGEFNPWQVSMGRATPRVLEDAGVEVYRVERAEDVVPTVSAGARLAFHTSRMVAVLIGQRVIGSKDFNRRED